MLTGKYEKGKAPPANSRATHDAGKKFVGNYMTDMHLDKARDLVELAQRHGLDATQVALAFCLKNPGVSSVLIGARDERQLEHNLTALDATLSDAVMTELDEIFPA